MSKAQHVVETILVAVIQFKSLKTYMSLVLEKLFRLYIHTYIHTYIQYVLHTCSHRDRTTV